jgi:hypothetical protein
MTEARRKKIVYAALVLAIIYGTYNFTVGRKPLQVTPPATIKPISADSLALLARDSLDISDISAAPWGRDPFGTRRISAAPTRLWELKGIVYSETAPLAYINGHRVGINQRVDGARVVRIDRKKVTLEFNGRSFDIYVIEG